MRIGVISDSHGDVRSIRQGLRQMGEIALLLHAGDHCTDIAEIEATAAFPVKAVRGNCDFGMVAPGEQIIDWVGKRILLLHGHQYQVKRTFSSLIAYAQTRAPDLVVFGHTHVPAVFTVGNTVFFNPGSLAYPRGKEAPSFGIVEVKPDNFVPYLHPLQADRKYFRVF